MAYRKIEGMDATIRNYSIKGAFPLIFWADCCKCDGEFRRELGWKFSYSPAFMMNCTRYICASCSPNIIVAADITRAFIDKLKRAQTQQPQAPLTTPPPSED